MDAHRIRSLGAVGLYLVAALVRSTLIGPSTMGAFCSRSASASTFPVFRSSNCMGVAFSPMISKAKPVAESKPPINFQTVKS